MSSCDIEKIKKHKDLILLAEIGALIHDLGKLSEEFVESKSEGSNKEFPHHLILRRFISGNDPYVAPGNSIKDVVLFFLNNYNFDQLPLKDSSELNNTLNNIKKELQNNSKQNRLKSDFWKEFSIIQGNLQKGKPNNMQSDIEAVFSKIRGKIKDKLKNQIKGEKLISTNFVDNTLKEILIGNWKDNFYLPFVNQKEQLNNFADFIEMHHETWHDELPYLIKLLKAPPGCDGVDSGIDKGTPARKQSLKETYISTAFGYEKDKIDLSKLAYHRNEFCNVLADELQKVIDEKNKNGDVENIIIEARNKILDAARKHFPKALGETRRAANDVTLWDHSYSVASLYKAALAGILIEYESSSDKQNYKLPDPKGMKWRILYINFDGLEFINKGLKIGDIRGRKAILDKTLDEVRKLVEVDFPIGNEIYRDENGIYFVVPDFKNDLETKFETSLTRKIVDIFQCKKKLEGEIIPNIEISSKPSRSLTTLAKYIDNAKNISSSVNSVEKPKWEKRWDDANKDPSIVFDKNICRISDCRYFTNEMCCYKKKIPIVICQICGVRPKCEKQDLCKICFEWREGRVEDWGEQINTGKEATIWLDEISDISNRVAVIVGKFDLSRWLNGEYLKTIFSQWLEDWYYQKNKDKRDIRDKLSEDLRILNYNLKYTEKEKYELVKELLLLIASNFRRCTSKKKMECYVRIFNTFVDYNIKTSSNDTAQTLREKLEKAFIGRRVIENQGEKIDIEFATLKLFKKHPSPARLRRIWSTTYNFWDELIENILKEKSLYISDIEASNIKKERKDYLKEIRFKRVHLKAKGFDEPGLYKLKINGVESEWYWDGRELISINNLQLLFGSYKSKNLKELRKELSKAKIELSNKEDSKKEIKIEPLDSESSYLPFTEIFKSPVSFIIIVPATSAVDIIKKIKEKYEDEFGKVRNRLPLHIGVIYFHRKAPLYIALNSVRRFFKGITENEYRRICAVCDFDVNIAKRKPEKIKLTFDKGVTPTEIKVPILTGHIDVDDNYYPYFLINKADNIEKRPSYFVGFRKSHSTGNNSLLKVPLLHVSDLQKDDEIEFVPSYFDFEFLDTNTKRFDIILENRKRPHRIFNKGPRPYYLEEIDAFQNLWNILCGKNKQRKKLTSSQINNFQTLLVSKIEEWGLKDVYFDKDNEKMRKFEKLVEDSIIRILEIKRDNHHFEFIKQSVLSGLFFDVIELFMTIMKEKPEEVSE